jgi:hypothetical protein
MLFVLVLELEGDQQGARVFRAADEARACYEEAARVCMDGPDEREGETPYAISNCWLFSADTVDEDAAREAALLGSADLIAVFSPE